MPIQTAPSSLTVTHADTTVSTLSLVDLADNLVTYAVTTFRGTAVSEPGLRASVTLSRRPSTAQNAGAKYALRLAQSSYNVLGQKVATLLGAVDLVRPKLWAPTAQMDTVGAQEILAQLQSNDLLLNMVDDGSFVR